MSDAWDVLMLFLIPIGGGIPGGVLLAQTRGIAWPLMMLIYLFSDIILACCFEPILKIFILFSRRIPFLVRWGEAFKQMTQKSIAHYGTNMGPLALIMVAFGVDPMTGRAAAVASGHGFLSGWLIAITGDMMYFTVLMVCTLWLKETLGDGTWAMMIILVLMIGVPILVRRIRTRFRN